MSRIYFHSEHDTAELRGSERAYMGMFCGRLLVATLEPLDMDWRDNPIRRLIPPDHYLLDYARRGNPAFAERFREWASVAMGEPGFVYQDREVSRFSAALNTALAIGNDPVKLMARLHGQCEIHCYVEGPNRAWLAGIMQAGRACNLYRANQGWEAVIALLQSRDDGPVVCSYSVCEQFPNAGIAYDAGLWQPTEDAESGELIFDEWYDLPNVEQWRLGMTALRAEPQRGLELTPETWAGFYVNTGVTGLDLRAWVDAPLDK
jgi:hypothetical protein